LYCRFVIIIIILLLLLLLLLLYSIFTTNRSNGVWALAGLGNDW